MKGAHRMQITQRGILVHPEDLREDWLDRMAAAGLNVLGLHPVGGKLAHESLARAVDTHILPESRRLRRRAAELNIDVEYEAHAMAYLVPRHLFTSVPEWFRMDENGSRTADFNLCASNPDALEYLSERCAQLARMLDTGADRYYFWLDDVGSCSCHCPECVSLSPSDQQLRIVNAMLAGLRRFNPRAKLCYLAYHDTLSVPRQTEPADGVFLEFAPFRRNAHRAICDPSCAENAREIAFLPDLLSFFGTKDAKILEYWMDNSMYSGWVRPPKRFALDTEVMKRDVDYYTALGFSSITSFGCYLGPDYDELYGKVPLDPYGMILNR